LVAAALGLQAASTQTLNQAVGALNAVLNPYQAQRLEDQERRQGRPAEERYWQRYRAGLDAQQGQNGGYNGSPGYGGDERQRYGSSYDPRGPYQGYGPAPAYNQPRPYQGYGSSSEYNQGPDIRAMAATRGILSTFRDNLVIGVA
jgi:hypothetical protein